MTTSRFATRGYRLIEFCQEKTLHMDITRWSTPKSDSLYSLQLKMEKLYAFKKNKTKSRLWLRSRTLYEIQTQIEESSEFRYDLN